PRLCPRRYVRRRRHFPHAAIVPRRPAAGNVYNVARDPFHHFALAPPARNDESPRGQTEVSVMPSVSVPGFLPSTCGFRFANFFVPQPLIRVPLAGLGHLPIGNASRGLCGGMVFATCDLFERGCPPPDDREPPGHGSPLFSYLVRRLFRSFHLPWGPLRYYRWMSADDDALLRHTVRREWPRVRRELDAGRLAALGLIRHRSRNPLRLGENHQVLAY